MHICNITLVEILVWLMVIKMQNIPELKGWAKYKDHTDKIADSIIEIAQNENLDINEVREAISKIVKKLQKKRFGTIWIRQTSKKI